MRPILIFNLILIIRLTAPIWRKAISSAVTTTRKAASAGFLGGFAIHGMFVTALMPPLPAFRPVACGVGQGSIFNLIDAPILKAIDWPNKPTRHADWVRDHVEYPFEGLVFFGIYGGIQWSIVGAIALTGYSVHKNYRRPDATPSSRLPVVASVLP